MKTSIAFALSIGIVASAANAQTVGQTITGAPMNLGPGGGCFNATINGVQLSVPYQGVSPTPPRGDNSAIDAVVNTLLTARTVTVTLGPPLTPQTCTEAGFSIADITAN